MPVSFLSNADRERLRHFPAKISSEDLHSFFTFSESDLAQIREQRGEHNVLGFALQLCALRYLGFAPDDLSNISDNVLTYVAQQLGVDKDAIKGYGKRIATRTQHLLAVQTYLGFQKASKQDFALLAQWLLERALEHDKPTLLLQLACEKLHCDKIVRPGLIGLEKMVAKARLQAQEKTHLLLMPLLTPALGEMLDKLLVVDPKINRTPHSWLRERAVSNSAQQILIGVDKLKFLKQLQVDKWDLSSVNPNRLRFLAKIGRKVNNQYLQRLNQQRRYPILIATLHQSLIDLTDEIIEIYDQCLFECYSDAREDLEDFQKSIANSTNAKLRLFQEIGKVLIDQTIADIDVRKVSFNRVPKQVLQQALEETQLIVRPNDGHFDYLAQRYSYIRRFSPAFLTNLSFHSDLRYDPLLEALSLICKLDSKGARRKIPDDAPLEFVPRKWDSYLFDQSSGKIKRSYYELSALWELRNALRAGNVWPDNSRKYANPNTYLIPSEKWSLLRPEVCRLINAPTTANTRLKELQEELTKLIPNVERLFHRNNSGLRFEKGKVIVSPLKAQERPESAEDLEKYIVGRLPRIEITDLLIEVDSWTNFSSHFKHAAKSEPRTKELQTNMYASILAQACNFGLEQMSQITDIPYRRIAWCNTWYIREETLKQAVTSLVNFHYHQPLSRLWGGGTLSSSDGQRFPVSVKTRMARPLPRYFGYGMGVTFHSWTSDQLSQWGTKPSTSTIRDATYVLDEILDNETELPLFEHTTDTSGYTDIIFAIFDLLGMRFSPRLRDLPDQRMFRLADMDITKFKIIKQRIRGIVKEKLIVKYWDDLLRIVGSLKLGWVTSSLLIQKLQSSARKSQLSKALQEYGKLAKTIHILRWYESEDNRHRINCQLNKGEALHALRSFICFANKGYIRRRYEDDIQNQASCLNLVTNAVIVWNTVYMAAVIEQLKSEGKNVLESDLEHLWPTRYVHINVHGKYRFNLDQQLGHNLLRPLRTDSTSTP